jgi:uncharacterized protein YcfJ
MCIGKVVPLPQLHLYVTEEVAEAARARARASGQSLSAYLAGLVQGQVAGEWPKDVFGAVVGGWRGRRLKRPPQGRLEKRECL